MTSKPCKYLCQAQLTWDTSKNAFVENDGTLHSKERCAYLKSLLPKTAAVAQPTVTSPNQFDQRQADIQKAHEENIAASRAHTAAINANSAVLAVGNDLLERYLKSGAQREEKIIELLETLIKLFPQFTRASNITSEVNAE